MNRGVVLFFGFALAMPPAVLRAQPEAKPTSSSSDGGPAPYGRGEQRDMRYAGESPATNFFAFSFGAEAAYDDNVLGNNADRRNSTLYSVSPRLSFGREGKSGAFAVDYSPDFTDYQQIEGRDQLNHRLQFDARARVGSHFQVRARNGSSYRNGFFRPQSGEQLVSDLGPPTDVNETVAVPLSRILTTNSRLDLVYQKSFRTALTVFGAHQLRDFLREETIQGRLIGLRGWNTGMEYAYRVSARTSISLLYLLRNQRFGEGSRLIVHSGFFSIARQFSPTVALQLFAGPLQTRLHDDLTLVLPLDGTEITVRARVFRIRWHASAGGTLTRQTKNTVFKISAERTESDGGGLFTASINNTAGLELGRRLGRRWEARWTARYTLTEGLGSDFSDSEIRGQRAGFALLHFPTRRLTVRWGYNFIRQRMHGQAPIRFDQDRNRASFGLYYQLGKVPLSR